MEQDREAKAPAQVAEWEEAKADRAKAEVVGGRVKVASEQDRVETAFAPAAVRKCPTRWEHPAPTSGVPRVGHP